MSGNGKHRIVIIAALLLTLGSLMVTAGLAAAEEPESAAVKVSAVVIEGNRRIDSEALRLNLKARPGDLNSALINEDIKTLYRLGFFEQVSASLVPAGEGGGRILRYVVVEKPVVRKVLIKGNKDVSESDLSEVLKFGERRFVDKTGVLSIIRRATAYYQQKGYYDAALDFSLEPVGENEVDVTFQVTEGERYKIEEVVFNGLQLLDEDDLRSAIQTKHYKWWNSWLLGTGRVNPEMLQNDKAILQQYLFDHGFVEGGVSEAVVEKRDDGLRVAFDVTEGRQYKVGSLGVSGDLIDNSSAATLAGVALTDGEVFSATKLREDSFKISEKFADRGYAFANVVPDTSLDCQAGLVNVNFVVNQGLPVTIDRILIRGNEKTYDNVIRRELKVQEQELYSATKLKRSQTLLERLGYFEEVSIATEPKPDKDKVDLKVNVREGSTGAFSAGAGYSTSDGAIFNVRISENNFLGTGRMISFDVDVGTERENYVLSLTDRRFNDTYWSTGIEAMRAEREFFDFDRTLTGGGVSFGYPLEEAFGSWAEDLSFSTKYQYLDIEITDVDPDSAQLVLDSVGTSTVSGVTPRLVRNTINNPLNPSSGSRQDLSIELTGLGGQEDYYLLEFRNTWYYPLFSMGAGNLVFSWRFHVGYGETYDGETFPLFRRYFPGGINSVRGFENRSLGPKDENGHEYGGNKELINNFELIFPLVESAGLKGVTFFDAGEAFDDNQSIDIGELRQAYGFGLRWMSPMGPIRIEFGFPLDKQEGEDSFVTMFSFGAPM